MPQLQCEEIRFPSADGVHTVAASMYTMPGVPVRASCPCCGHTKIPARQGTFGG